MDKTPQDKKPRRRATSPPPSFSAHNLVFDVANWHPKPVKRPRPVKSCTECRRRKLRCSRSCPCSQCQRSYRVCTYGSGSTDGAGGSSSRGVDANNPNAESDASEEGSGGDEDSKSGDAAGERPFKRHSSRPPSVSTPQDVPAGGSSSGHPPPNSSLSLLLNPPSPSSSTFPRPSAHHVPQPPYAPVSSAASLPPTSGTITASTTSAPLPTLAFAVRDGPVAAPMSVPLSVPASHPGFEHISGALTNPRSPLLTLNGPELRQFTSALIEEFSARMERLEKLVLAKDASALSAIPPFPSSATLSQLHVRQQPQDPRRHLIDASSATMRDLSVKGPKSLRTRLFGQNSTRVLLNLFDEAKDFIADKNKRDTAANLFSALERIHLALQEDHVKTLKPITVYVDSMMPVQKRMADILPRRDVCDRLLDVYVNVSEGLYRVIHVPTFRQEFEAFWADGVSGGGGNTTSNGFHTMNGASGPGSSTSRTPGGVAEDFLPRLLCILCIGSRFEAESKGLAYDRPDSVHIPTACALVRSWLDSLRGKHSIDVHTLQAEMLLLHANRMIASRPQRIWTELGVISRMAMTMGLHRDPSEFGSQLSPFQAEFRRKLWFTIMDMDLHVSLASGLPHAIRVDEFTCQPPRNLDDVDIYPEIPALPPAKPISQYTDGQMQAFASGTLPLRMRANDLLCHIDALTDYGEVLTVGGELEKALDDINRLFPRNTAVGHHKKFQVWRMRAMLDMHIRRPLLALYRPFALSASADCPPPTAISDVYLKSSMAMLTYMEELDPSMPAFDDVSYMYYLILRHDIVQAAFSVCYYIMQTVEAETEAETEALDIPTTAPANHPSVGVNTQGGSGAAGPGSGAAYLNRTTVPTLSDASPRSGGENGGAGSGETHRNRSIKAPSSIWPSTYLIRAVERTMENLARLANDLSFDLRDVVALATVLGSVMPATGQTQRNENIRAQVGRVLDVCIENLRGHASPAIRSAVSGQEASHPPDWYTRPQFASNDKEVHSNQSSTLWDTYFWDPWALDQAHQII